MGQTVCVYCRGRDATPDWAPFCSERCKLLDLRNWMDGRYRVPGEDAPAGGDDTGRET